MRFYAYPPKEIDYPYILRNINQKSVHKNICHQIVDIGVMDLLKTENHKHTAEKLQKWSDLTMCNIDGWKVVPDCPDLHKEYNIDMSFDNVQYSKELLLEYFDEHNYKQLPVIQSYYNDPGSMKDFTKWFKREFPNYTKKFGLGTLCRSNNKALTLKACHIVRKAFPEAWLHAFGLRLNYVSDLIGIINSFDSSAWTFPRGRGRGSAKNKSQRIEFFFDYLVRIH